MLTEITGSHMCMFPPLSTRIGDSLVFEMVLESNLVGEKVGSAKICGYEPKDIVFYLSCFHGSVSFL